MPGSSAYLLCDDLLWTSRIGGTARPLGLKVKNARGLEQLEQLCREEAPRCVIIDLGLQALPVADVVNRVQAVCSERPRFVAFGSHVDVAALKAARDAGCDPVLPRSKLAEALPELLKSWMAE